MSLAVASARRKPVLARHFPLKADTRRNPPLTKTAFATIYEPMIKNAHQSRSYFWLYL